MMAVVRSRKILSDFRFHAVAVAAFRLRMRRDLPLRFPDTSGGDSAFENAVKLCYERHRLLKNNFRREEKIRFFCLGGPS